MGMHFFFKLGLKLEMFLQTVFLAGEDECQRGLCLRCEGSGVKMGFPENLFILRGA